MGLSKLQKRKGKLDYVPKKSGFEEDDGFYHLRIGR